MWRNFIHLESSPYVPEANQRATRLSGSFKIEIEDPSVRMQI